MQTQPEQMHSCVCVIRLCSWLYKLIFLCALLVDVAVFEFHNTADTLLGLLNQLRFSYMQ